MDKLHSGKKAEPPSVVLVSKGVKVNKLAVQRWVTSSKYFKKTQKLRIATDLKRMYLCNMYAYACTCIFTEAFYPIETLMK